MDIWNKLVNSFCRSQISMHFVTEGEFVSLFSTPENSYSQVQFQYLPRPWRGMAAPSHDLSLTDLSAASHTMKTTHHKKRVLHSGHNDSCIIYIYIKFEMMANNLK